MLCVSPYHAPHPRPHTPPSPPLAFASCLLLIRGPWRRPRSVPWSRFKILSDCCTRERGWGRAGTWPPAPPLQVRRWGLCDVMMASPDCPHRAIFRPRLVHFTIYASHAEKKGWKRSWWTSSSQNSDALTFFQFSALKCGKQMSCCCLLCSRANPISSRGSRNRSANAQAAEWDWPDGEQTFALKHDHLLPITLSELIFEHFLIYKIREWAEKQDIPILTRPLCV